MSHFKAVEDLFVSCTDEMCLFNLLFMRNETYKVHIQKISLNEFSFSTISIYFRQSTANMDFKVTTEFVARRLDLVRRRNSSFTGILKIL